MRPDAAERGTKVVQDRVEAKRLGKLFLKAFECASIRRMTESAFRMRACDVGDDLGRRDVDLHAVAVVGREGDGCAPIGRDSRPANFVRKKDDGGEATYAQLF